MTLQDSKSDPLVYTVGWVCAVAAGYVAARAFLDEEHSGPAYVAFNDSNDYILGRVGTHNVVITVLSDGDYGSASAATVAKDMLHSFPNIRMGLLVGTGGGAPTSKRDIRLGDVVVSSPCNGKGGVFQYDFGKTIQGQEFLTTGYLNQPPTILRTAVTGLKARYEADGHKIAEMIETVLANNCMLRTMYGKPDAATDRLYHSSEVHPQEVKEACASVCSSSASVLVSRTKRGEYEDDPAIHYGMIASANCLMKDAQLRDKLAQQHGVLCFEMEAAGLMNVFPCLVIRGICNYSYTHKNKDWQGYAAMTATAYAKELLTRIARRKVLVAKYGPIE